MNRPAVGSDVGGKRPQNGFSERAPIFRFAAVFGLQLTAFYALVLIPWFQSAYYGYLCLNARLLALLVNIFGANASASGVTVRSGAYAVAIQRGCDAIEPSWFFCAAVLAYPAPWRSKPKALLFGVAIVQALNVLRILTLYYTGMWSPRFFGFAHLELWPVLFIMTCLSLWITWIRSAGSLRKLPDHDE
jgi:exosortase H (IPTLxxWG-CTERM-specific)